MAASNKKDTFTVIYRTGGWMNAEWHLTAPRFPNRARAGTFADGMERQGYKALIQFSSYVDKAGLPVGFCEHSDPMAGRPSKKNCGCT